MSIWMNIHILTAKSTSDSWVIAKNVEIPRNFKTENEEGTDNPQNA